MRKTYPSYSLLTLSGLILAGSCSIIAEVDRTKIPQDGNPPGDGGQNTGGTAGNTGGTAGNGTGGMPTGGTGGDAGGGGEPTGGTSTGGAGGDPGGMGGAGMAGAGDGGVGGDPGSGCGDGMVDAPETCDDGPNPMSNDGCSATCAEEAGWNCTGEPSVCTAAACGDGIRAGAEACDDGNTNVCGNCSADCATATPSARATGTLTLGATAPADIDDGDYFTLNDGINTTPTEFEFDLLPADNGITRAGAIEIDVDTTQTDAVALRAAIVTAINGVTTTLRINAGGTGAPIDLANDVNGSHGNRSTGDEVDETSFTLSPTMSGGGAHDCTVGIGCTSDTDCQLGDCLSPSNQCN